VVAGLLAGRPRALPALRDALGHHTPTERTPADRHRRIDPSACAAHGDCLDVAPGAFAMRDSAVVVGTAPPSSSSRGRGLPAVAITILDDETGEQLFP